MIRIIATNTENLAQFSLSGIGSAAHLKGTGKVETSSESVLVRLTQYTVHEGNNFTQLIQGGRISLYQQNCSEVTAGSECFWMRRSQQPGFNSYNFNEFLPCFWHAV